jgi:lysophospholipase L1-like esterase
MTSLLVGLMLVVSAAFMQQHATPDATPVAPDLDTGAPVYLALGDSLAYGIGATDPEATGYVPLLHAMLQEGMDGGDTLQLANISENGATSTTLLENQLPMALQVIDQHNGDDDPNNDVEIITIDIGGNDAFRPLLEVCGTGLNQGCIQAVEEIFGTLSANLAATLGQLRAAAGPDVPIAIMTYANSLIACDQQAIAPAAELVLEGAPDGSMPGMNDLIREVASGTGAIVAEAYGLLGAEDLVGGTDCLHPNDAGHQRIADAFAAAILGSSATPVAATPVTAAQHAARW